MPILFTDDVLADSAKHLCQALRSPYYERVKRRIFRQLIESLIYEGLVEFQREKQQGSYCYTLFGQDHLHRQVRYRITGHPRVSFGRIRLDENSLKKQVDNHPDNRLSVSGFIDHISANLGTERVYIERFTHELAQTLLNDTLAQYVRGQQKHILRHQPYDDVESALADGHPYHPCYKSRIGYNLEDNLAFAPEFQQSITPILLAAHMTLAETEHSSSLSLKAFYRQEFSRPLLERCSAQISAQGGEPDDYQLIPIHPWQWRNVISQCYLEEIQSGQLVYIGPLEDDYLAQQSIRTLANVSCPAKNYLKFAISIQNTSTSRILSPHTVKNAPIVSDWLTNIHRQDPLLSTQLRLILLREVVGTAVSQLHKDGSAPSYGALSCIWRENLASHLCPKETAMPFSALSYIDGDGLPIIHDWVQSHSISHWVTALLKTTITPLIHLLYAHGVALESHGQNAILVHQDGLPTRLALKDFHDGVRYVPALLRDPEQAPRIYSTPDNHLNINRNSYIEVESPQYIRDFLLDSAFFINLSEIALFLDEHYQFPESEFWRLARRVIVDYQVANPQLKQRYQQLDLFVPAIEVEQLTKRRLFPDDGNRAHRVPNPLALSALED